jgi:hypothetical protein
MFGHFTKLSRLSAKSAHVPRIDRFPQRRGVRGLKQPTDLLVSSRCGRATRSVVAVAATALFEAVAPD